MIEFLLWTIVILAVIFFGSAVIAGIYKAIKENKE